MDGSIPANLRGVFRAVESFMLDAAEVRQTGFAVN